MTGSALKRARKQGIRLGDGANIAFSYKPRVVDLPPGFRHFSTADKITHLLDRPNNVPGPTDQVARSKGITPIFEVVAGVSDRGDNEAGLSKGQCGIEMAAGPTAAPVRDHNQRQPRS